MKKLYVLILLFLYTPNMAKTAQRPPLLTIEVDEFGENGSTIFVFKDQMPFRYTEVPGDFKWRVAPSRRLYDRMRYKSGLYALTACPYNRNLFIYSELGKFSNIMKMFFEQRRNTRGPVYTFYLKRDYIPLFVREARKFERLINEPWRFHIVLMDAHFPEACALVSSAIKENQKKELNILHAIKHIHSAKRDTLPHDVVALIGSFLPKEII